MNIILLICMFSVPIFFALYLTKGSKENHWMRFKQFMNTGSYTWPLLMAAGYAVCHKRYRDLIVCTAPFMNVLVCIASPVNGEIRYVLPLMAVTPILACWCYISGCHYIENKSLEKV